MPQGRLVFEEESLSWSRIRIPHSADYARNDRYRQFVKDNFYFVNHAVNAYTDPQRVVTVFFDRRLRK